MNRAFICIPGFPIEFTNSSLSPVSLLILALQSVTRMSDWFHDLPLVWMAVAVFGFTCLLAGGIHIVVHALAVGERACRLSPCHLACPLGYRLRAVCGFTAAQAWSDGANASATVDREASALRSVTLLAASFRVSLKSPACAGTELHCRSKSPGLAAQGATCDHSCGCASCPVRSL
jgi:hypothetical protein